MISEAWTGRHGKIEFAQLNPADCAIVLHHMQNEFAHPDGKGSAICQQYIEEYKVIPKLKTLLEAARKLNIPVIFNNETWRPGFPEFKEKRGNHLLGSGRYFELEVTQTAVRGTWGAEPLADLWVKEKDYVLDNSKVDPFSNSEFETLLKNEGRTILINGGLETNLGVEMCARSASEREYGVVTLYDCTDKALEEYAELSFKYIFPMYGRVANHDEIIAEWQNYGK